MGKVDIVKISPFIRKAVKKLVEGKKIAQTKGTGASGRFKAVKEAAKPKKAKKPKKKAVKKVKKTAAKKTPKKAKKPAAKKSRSKEGRQEESKEGSQKGRTQKEISIYN